MMTVGDMNQALCELHRAEKEMHRATEMAEVRHYRRRVWALKEAILSEYESALTELNLLRRSLAVIPSRK